jgi:hypothetical protein
MPVWAKAEEEHKRSAQRAKNKDRIICILYGRFVGYKDLDANKRLHISEMQPFCWM